MRRSSKVFTLFLCAILITNLPQYSVNAASNTPVSKNDVASFWLAERINKAIAFNMGFENGSNNPNCDAVDGDYIITFNRNANVRAEINGAPGKSVSPQFIYEAAANGFAATLSAEQVCAFRKRPNVESIERDQTFQNQTVIEQSVNTSSWNLDRIDTITRTYDSKYSYTSNGSSVTAYIFDTGINSSHIDFTGRVLPGYSAIKGSRSTEDCNGHGTHVAGSVGGSNYGVAKQVKLVPIRVLGCSGSGSTSGIVAGLDWVLKQTSPINSQKIVNMSLGGGASSTLDSAVAKLTNAGISVVVAAGNSKANACNYSPARAPSAITVAASDSNDTFASFSNFGSCVDIIAPGVAITSDWIGSSTATNSISGTSMASPHVAGAVARYISSSRTIKELLDNSIGIVAGVPTNTVNKLLFIDPAK